jgi:hypothetical protein
MTSLTSNTSSTSTATLTSTAVIVEPLIFLQKMAPPPPQRLGWEWGFGSLILALSVLCGLFSAWYGQRNYRRLSISEPNRTEHRCLNHT